MGILNKVLGLANKIPIGDIMDKIDDSKLTQAEKAEIQMKYMNQQVDENSIRSKTRRYLAKVVVWNVFAIFWLCVGIHFAGFDLNPILKLVGVFQLGWAFVAVVVFYFGGYYGPKFIKNKDKKKS